MQTSTVRPGSPRFVNDPSPGRSIRWRPCPYESGRRLGCQVGCTAREPSASPPATAGVGPVGRGARTVADRLTSIDHLLLGLLRFRTAASKERTRQKSKPYIVTPSDPGSGFHDTRRPRSSAWTATTCGDTGDTVDDDRARTAVSSTAETATAARSTTLLLSSSQKPQPTPEAATTRNCARRPKTGRSTSSTTQAILHCDCSITAGQRRRSTLGSGNNHDAIGVLVDA